MKPSRIFLKILRKFYRTFFYNHKIIKNNYLKENKVMIDPNLSNKNIFDMLMSKKPCLISRFGRSEFSLIRNYLGFKNKKINYLDFIKDKSPANWIEDKLVYQMHAQTGFFHHDLDSVIKFCEVYLNDLPNIDLLGVNMIDPNLEHYFQNYIKDSKKVDIEHLSPFFSENPWSLALENKKILVIHPFSELITSQFQKKDYLFKNKILPDFKLITFKPVESLKGEKVKFKSWFDALENMKLSIGQIDFDIALVACGAYGLPLSAHIKSMEKKAFHLGGALQLLFGIIGQRWINYKYSKFGYQYNQLFNSYWTRPSHKEKIKNAKNADNAAYW